MIKPVLTYPSSAIVGATDIHRMAVFLTSFGMLPKKISTIPAEAAAALYGLAGDIRELEMYTPGVDRTIRIIETPNAAQPFAPLTGGPYGLDFFSRDLDVTIGMVKATGGHNFTDLVGYTLEPSKHPDADLDTKNYEILFQGPDELTIYVTDIDKSGNSYPTLLGSDPELVNSELVMLCWITETPDVERAFWESEAGVDVTFDGYAENEGMVDLMFHPEPTLLRCINITDTGQHTKIELMSYPDAQITTPPTWPLRGGLFAGSFVVDDIEATIASLPSASFGETVRFEHARRGSVAAVTALSPSGVRFELLQLGL